MSDDLLSPSKAEAAMASRHEEAPHTTGNPEQQMREKPFTIWTAMGLGHSITNTAVAIIVGLGNALPFGGPPVLFYGFLMSSFAGLCIAVSLGELGSAFPHAGGQYFWVATLAPPSYRRFLSYLIGILSWAGGLCVTASVTLVSIEMIVEVIVLSHPSFPNKPWVVFVGYQIVNLLALPFNFYERCLPWASRTLLVYTPAVLFSIFVALLAGNSQKQPADAVFSQLSNASGWPAGIGFLIGLNPSAWAFSCLDAVVHVADEIPQPRKNIPKALICTVALGFVTGLPITLAFMFAPLDLDAAVSAPMPSLEIYQQVFNSNAAATAIQSTIIVSSFGAVIGSQTWQSRMAWAFARDKALPFYAHISRVAGRPWNAPIWAHLWSSAWIAVLGCLYLGSRLAFNSLVAGGVLLQYITYSTSICFLLWVGRSNITPGPFWFPKLGLIANLFTISWSLVMLVVFSFPYYLPVLADEMNYVSVVLVAIVLYALGYWIFHGKRAYSIAQQHTTSY